MKSILAAAVFCLLSGAVYAKPEPFTPAPVPAVDNGQVTPADRAGDFSGDVVDTPFSAQPNNLISGRGQVSQDNEDNSGRQTAPSPNLAK